MGNVPRGTNAGKSRISTVPNLDTPAEQSSATAKITPLSKKFRKFSTAGPFLPVSLCRSLPRREALPLLIFARFSPPPIPEAFHRRVPFSTAELPTQKSPCRFTLKGHGKDSRRCKSKRRSWQDHHCHQPRRMPRSRRPQGPPCRLRPPGQRLLRSRFSARRQSPLHL